MAVCLGYVAAAQDTEESQKKRQAMRLRILQLVSDHGGLAASQLHKGSNTLKRNNSPVVVFVLVIGGVGLAVVGRALLFVMLFVLLFVCCSF